MYVTKKRRGMATCVPQVGGVKVNAGGGLQAEAVSSDGGPGACAAQQLLLHETCLPGRLRMKAEDRHATAEEGLHEREGLVTSQNLDCQPLAFCSRHALGLDVEKAGTWVGADHCLGVGIVEECGKALVTDTKHLFRRD